jgi:hypothetical protein
MRSFVGVGAMGIVDHVILSPAICKENNKWGNVGYVLYSLHG